MPGGSSEPAAVTATPGGPPVPWSYVTIDRQGPVAVVRCGRSPEGLPIGVQVVGRPWTEDVVLAVAKHLEREFGGWQPTRL